MEDLKLYTAKVVDIKDSNKLGMIKIRILPYFDKIVDNDLPWAVPFVFEQSSTTLSNDLPRVDSTIRVLADKYWKKFYWLGNRYFNGLFDYSKIENKVKNVSVDSTYENLKFRLYDDGGLEFHNNSEGSHGFIHKSGSYALFDKDGKIIIDAKEVNTTTDNVKTETKDYTCISTNGFTIKNNQDSLGSLLAELIQDLAGLTTTGSPTNHTSPQLTTQMIGGPNALLPRVQALLK